MKRFSLLLCLLALTLSAIAQAPKVSREEIRGSGPSRQSLPAENLG